MLQEPKDDQQELEILINKLNNDCNPVNQTKIKEKNDALKSEKKCFFMRKKIINAFSEGIFLYIDGFQVEKESDEESTLENEDIDTTDMSESESGKSAGSGFSNSTKGKGLKILTPSQMLSRLPITLAQLKAGNNSEKLRNEIRQILYSLYRSKKPTTQIYKSLIDII